MMLAMAMAAALVLASTMFGAVAQSGCGGGCQSGDDCEGQLTCISGKCDDDPSVGTNICGGGGGSSGGTCPATGQNSDTCCNSGTCQKVSCSPPVSASGTPATLTLNDFEKGGDGGGPSKCDDDYHSDDDRVAALSTGWYAGGTRCGRQIRINGNGRSTTATVVDECDSQNGCDSEHAGQPPCANNIVDASAAVWSALGVSPDSDMYGFMSVTWQDV
jgi:hypothetical protein